MHGLVTRLKLGKVTQQNKNGFKRAAESEMRRHVCWNLSKGQAWGICNIDMYMVSAVSGISV